MSQKNLIIHISKCTASWDSKITCKYFNLSENRDPFSSFRDVLLQTNKKFQNCNFGFCYPPFVVPIIFYVTGPIQRPGNTQDVNVNRVKGT